MHRCHRICTWTGYIIHVRLDCLKVVNNINPNSLREMCNFEGNRSNKHILTRVEFTHESRESNFEAHSVDEGTVNSAINEHNPILKQTHMAKE